MTIEGRSDGIDGGRIRLGMVGGGQGAFIGAVHRLAARMDDQYVLVAGALSSDETRARISGEELGLAPDRIYSDFREMAKREAKRNDGIEAVSIVTPNHLHFPVSKAFMEAGIHVICDKPLVHTSREAKALMELEKKRDWSSRLPIIIPDIRWSGRRVKWCRQECSARSAWCRPNIPKIG